MEALQLVRLLALLIIPWIAELEQRKVHAFVFEDEAYDALNPLLLAKPHLRFQGLGTEFRIAIMSDLHYGEDAWTDWGPQQDVKSTRVQDYILDTEKPDLVIYLGDQITANNIVAANSSKYWIQSMNPAGRRSIPHVSVFGNHDDAFTVYDESWFGASGIPGLPAENVGYYHSTTREDLTKEEMEMATSLTRAGPKALWPGMSNFVLPVGSAKTPGTAAVLLYFIDSGGGSYPEIVSASQAAWFKAMAAQMNPSSSIPELVFFHIPTKTHQKVGPVPKTSIPSPCVGSLNFETVAPQVQEKGLMDFLTDRKSVKAVFTGHNHGLDWCCPHHHMWLCFARHTGYGGYGNWVRGSRILQLVEEPAFALTTWIRLETGHLEDQIDLF